MPLSGTPLRLSQEPLLERTGKLELFLQAAERNSDKPFVDVLHNARAKRFMYHSGTHCNIRDIHLWHSLGRLWGG